MAHESLGGDFLVGSSHPAKVLPSNSSFQPAAFSWGVSWLSAAIMPAAIAIPIHNNLRMTDIVHGFVYNVQVLRAFALLLLTAAAAFAQDTRVILLGTGTPNPDPERMGPAVAIVSAGHVYLVDCGPGVVRRAVQAGLNSAQLTRLFITHLHSDHTAGYPDVILTPPNADRVEPLEVWGPPGIRAMTSHLLKAWKQDFHIRLHGTQPGEPRGFTVIAHDA